jgi:hypothetical protein
MACAFLCSALFCAFCYVVNRSVFGPGRVVRLGLPLLGGGKPLGRVPVGVSHRYHHIKHDGNSLENNNIIIMVSISLIQLLNHVAESMVCVYVLLHLLSPCIGRKHLVFYNVNSHYPFSKH